MATIREKAAALNLSEKLFSPMHRPQDHRTVPKPYQADVIWNSIISNLQAQVKVKRRRHYLRSHNNCFVGSDAVDVIQAHIVEKKLLGDMEVPRTKVVWVCQTLMDWKVFEAVGTKVFGKENKLLVFQDSNCSLYRFLNTESSLKNRENVQHSSGEQSPCFSSCSYRQDDQVCSHSTPVKSFQSLEALFENLDLSPRSAQANSTLSQSLINEVWQEQTILRLLQLVDLPLLEGLLDRRENQSPPSNSPNKDPDLLYTSNYMDREILKAFRDSQTDDWLQAALDCLDFLPDQLVVEISRELPDSSFQLGDEDCGQSMYMVSEQCKLLLFDILTKHYGHANIQPLLTNSMFDIYAGIIELMETAKFEQALEALQLCLKLLPQHSREELRRLLHFMALAADPAEVKLHKETENRMVVKKVFSKAIVHSKCLPKGKVDLLVLFMLDNHQEIFKIPGSLHKLVSERLNNITQGKDTHTKYGSTFCHQVTSDGYEESVKRNTKEELFALLKTIDEDPKCPVKERKRLLTQFYQGHPEIFVQYFGPRADTVNFILEQKYFILVFLFYLDEFEIY
ncbi:DEP domain-containing protein 7-like [Chanos chanos]|uniref:DEP domain-containing protein 7 n=1 Tax=Chanos chanos TaxID=29144 RepID=A0A6J2WKS5_CHACN|nr:DEP domain-containing protein 7-like [Chanos chanos]